MNVVSKTISTLAQIIDATIAGFKVGFDMRTKGRVRDMTFVDVFFIGDDCVEVWASDLMIQTYGSFVDRPNAICVLPQVVENDTNHYYIYVSRSALEDPTVRDALVAHECGHIVHKHLYNAIIASNKPGLSVARVLREANCELEADRYACEQGFGDTLRKIISDAKEASLRSWFSRKSIKELDARIAAIDNWTVTSRK